MKVVAFYRFTDIDDPEKLRVDLLALCQDHGLLGTLLVAKEGVNGSLTGSGESVQAVFDWLQERLSLAEPIEGRWNEASEAPFRRMRVKIRSEIVTLGRPDIRPDKLTGKHIGADEWNALIARPDALIIDTRNHYEFEVGTFPNAVDPGTDNFRQFADFANKLDEDDKKRPLAMFCTGGIRCEKATALMLELGFDEVYQLQGGILKYLETVAEENNRWDGECFVFDTRVAVDRDLAEGGYVQCHACRRPLSDEDVKSADYREGISCPRCVNSATPEREERLAERQKQVELARERGEAHIGAVID
ncbi:MAG: rhodanese-related sulfurtransferase [Gammaproteobacteria bacterium]|nr:MAG: rhodanese-related sulfurtransferase [Gammaproteobacteria bacterium]